MIGADPFENETSISAMQEIEGTLRKRIAALEADIRAEHAESVSRGKMLVKCRNTLINVRDGIEDEGDRRYFGSTNDADTFSEIVQMLDDFKWALILKEKDEQDLLERCREANERADRMEQSFISQRERYARIAREGCLVPPDGGEPTEEEREICERIATAILESRP